jgi:hypothetical protein
VFALGKTKPVFAGAEVDMEKHIRPDVPPRVFVAERVGFAAVDGEVMGGDCLIGAAVAGADGEDVTARRGTFTVRVALLSGVSMCPTFSPPEALGCRAMRAVPVQAAVSASTRIRSGSPPGRAIGWSTGIGSPKWGVPSWFQVNSCARRRRDQPGPWCLAAW